MIRTMLLALILISAPLAALAQDDTEGSNPGAENKLSIGTGIGFATPIAHAFNSGQTGFEWQLDVMYRITKAIAVGAWMQVVPVDQFVGFSLTGEARYHFNFLQSRKGFLGKLTPYVGGGIGLYHVGGPNGNASYDGLLFSFPVGIEFDLTDRIALTNEMRFNFMAAANKPAIGRSDTFYYSWQMIGARFRF